MGKIIEVDSLYKRYGGKEVLKNLSFSIEEGSVLGILGPNGSGKTTLLNILGGLTKGERGIVKVDGEFICTETKKIISYLRDNNNLYDWMRVSTAIKFYKDFYDNFDANKCKEILEFMNINEKDKIKKLSKGNIEKVALSLVLSRKSKIYILDEPISGVDILTREEIINVILNFMLEGASVIITTHYIGEVERLFDRVLFMSEGKIIEEGDAEEIRAEYGTSIEGVYKSLFSRKGETR